MVENAVIVDTKAANTFNETHLTKMPDYLNLTCLKTALLLNSKYAKLEIKRVTNQPISSSLSVSLRALRG